ncbi:MAG: L-ribulose-5-phosphate 3-epimerase [Acidimicrobiia bacterium]|jgi:predicted hexulose-6-phosphate isomerase
MAGVTGRYSLGIYEKALRSSTGWEVRLAEAREAGFEFVEMSIDPSPDRLPRLDWLSADRLRFRRQVTASGIDVPSICLSAHRDHPLGSSDPERRLRGAEILGKAIELAGDIDVRVVQIAGYYTSPDDRHPDARACYVAALAAGAEQAAKAGVMLAIENVDGPDINSVTRAMEVVDEIGSPWLQVYPDIGNIAENELDTVAELTVAKGHMVALHAKDVRVGEPRRVPFGEGVVDFDLAFDTLARLGYFGRLMIEMWNDDAPDSVAATRAARSFIIERIERAELQVAS